MLILYISDELCKTRPLKAHSPPIGVVMARAVRSARPVKPPLKFLPCGLFGWPPHALS